MKDVKGLVPVSGDWWAVYASDEPDNWTMKIQPVLFWACLDGGEKDPDEFVGVVEIGPSVVLATAPDLLGYARHDEEPRTKFEKALEAYKNEQRTGAKARQVAELTGAFCVCCDPPRPLDPGLSEHSEIVLPGEDEDEPTNEPN